MNPDGSFTLHQPIQPPATRPSSTTIMPSRAIMCMRDGVEEGQAARRQTSGGAAVRGDGADGDGEGERPCVPPHGPCPGPIPPHHEGYQALRLHEGDLRVADHVHSTPQQVRQSTHSNPQPVTDYQRESRPRPHAHSLNQGLPISHLASAPVHSSPPVSMAQPLDLLQDMSSNVALLPIQDQDQDRCRGHGQRRQTQPPPTASLPPSYKPLPSSAEDTLLLAPPPSFYASTCPFSHHYQNHAHARACGQSLISPQTPENDSSSRSRSRWARIRTAGPGRTGPLLPTHSVQARAQGIGPTHTCPHCFDLHAGDEGEDDDYAFGSARSDSMDLIVALLVLLNIIVWSAVIYGYVQEFINGTGSGNEWNWPKWELGNTLGIDPEAFRFSVSNACLGPAGAAGWGQICAGEECRWAFVDC
ncbi:hypothetical protein I316_05482 [Kwoniella heveanensis BCC8398]|uniref:Uncharacterized protein n=1 Tax=Kwoniella heveanensis BCC8398 TaxID=1296120 RepID=A0A1B9GPB3_9TREE|nr:hypothetical protein I316_05482 [Kwoniella heveanensis BCC8398]